MGVVFANNWINIIDKLENLLRTEFGGSLKVYRGVKDNIQDNQYLIIMPSESNNVDYFERTEVRDYGINIILHYKFLLIYLCVTMRFQIRYQFFLLLFAWYMDHYILAKIVF